MGTLDWRRAVAATAPFTPHQWQHVHHGLRRQWSPEQIAGRLRRDGAWTISHETIYAHMRTGEVVGHTAARHTSAEFVGFLQTVVETQPRRRELHIIVDNLSAHKTQ